MHIPAYPLFTLDPFTTIWSKTDELNRSDTIHWTGKKMPMSATVRVDNVTYRLMGKGMSRRLKQEDVRVSPVTTEYVFRGKNFVVELRFSTPMRMDDTETLAYPFSYLDYRFSATDGSTHDVEFTLCADESVCYEKRGAVKCDVQMSGDCEIASMGLAEQTPLSEEGDSVKINWGYAYLAVQAPGKARIRKTVSGLRISANSAFSGVKERSGTFVFAYDDVESIDYFGDRLQGYWHTRFGNIIEAIEFAVAKHDELLGAAKAFSEKLLSDASSPVK